MKFLAGLIGLTLLTAACSGMPGGDEPPQGASQVRVEGFLFHPDRLTIAAGATVTWENRDEILHTATSGTPGAETGLFDGEMGEQEATFAFTFDEPGTYAYFCTRHNHMRGTIVVE
jgi:plastocyanin